MFSGHVQTEAFRNGLHGPYALVFNTGVTPSTWDAFPMWDQFAGSVKGYVPKSGRGRVIGKASGYPSADTGNVVVGWANTAAQYWYVNLR